MLQVIVGLSVLLGLGATILTQNAQIGALTIGLALVVITVLAVKQEYT